MRAGRSLQTILFTDIVGSTRRAAELGDRRWRDLLREHDRRIRAALRRFLGSEVNTAGDGFVARFDDPGRAILCAAAIQDSLRDLGIGVRCGLHMGQVEGEGAESTGIAVHLGARVAGEADVDEILVSRSVRDSVEGAGFAFEDLGARELKGAPGERRIFRLTGLPEDEGALAPGAWERLGHRLAARRGAAAASLGLVLALAGGYALYRAVQPEAALARGIRSLAVLPLDNLTGDPDQEYFADGMTEALITELSKLGALRVISRTSSMRFKKAERSLPEIAEALGVTGIVEGSVVRDGDRVRISAQLIHAGSDTHLWAESFEGDFSDVLQVQGEIARQIAREIEIALTPEEAARLSTGREVDPAAYEAYLRGNYHLNQMSPAGIERGLELLNEAVEKDPGNPLPYAGLARGYSLLASHTPEPPPDAFERAQAAYRRALELDPDFAEAHAAAAERKLYLERDWEGAEASFRRALELNPNLPGTHAHYAWYLNLFDRQEEALEEMRRAVQIDPLTPLYAAWLAEIQMFGGDFEGGEEAARRALEIDPDFGWAHASLGVALAGQGRYEEAVEVVEPAPPSPVRAPVLGAVYALAGRTADARAVAAELAADPDPLKAISLVLVYAALGDHDRAARWLAFEPPHPWVPWLRTWPLLGDFRQDPRLRAKMESLGLPPP